MPRNIVDVSAFTDPVTVPVNGEAVAAETRDASFQALSNRTRFLTDARASHDTRIAAVEAWNAGARLDAIEALVGYGGLVRTVAAGSAPTQNVEVAPAKLVGFDGTQAADGAGNIVASTVANTITITQAGRYEFHATISFAGTADTTFILRVFVNGVGVDIRCEVRTDSVGSAVNTAISGILNVAAGVPVEVQIAAGAASKTITMRSGSAFWVRRID